jgi:hypothetical protein
MLITVILTLRFDNSSIPALFESAYNRDTCTPMFMATLFTVARLRNHPWRLSTDDKRKHGRSTQWKLLSHKEE